ncbi:hypothetical protein ACVBEQ_15230 [Nakamurella sp. GG22]
MKRSLWTARPLLAVGAAGVLLVAGCSSSDSGGSTTSSASSSAASSAAESSVASSSEAVTSGSSESSGSGATSGSVAPAELDEQTVAWFTTLCTGVAPIQELSNLDTSGQDPATAQKTGVDALTKFGTVLSDTSEKLASAEPPTFEGGEQFASQMTTGLAESGPKLAELAKTFGAINPSDTAALQQASSGLATQLQSAVAPLQALGELPADVSAAAQQIPACQALNG